MASRNTYTFSLMLVGIALAACTGQVSSSVPMTLQSDDFAHNTSIPPSMTCDGDGVRPVLRIANVPANAKSLALIMEDADGLTSMATQWIVWNIDPATTVIRNGDTLTGATEGLNDAAFPGYVGPCPSEGMHRYRFRLYALNDMLPLPADTLPAHVKKEWQTRTIAEAELIGLYARQELRTTPTPEADNVDVETDAE